MMNSVTVPKKMPMSFQVITFLSIVASGRDRPTTAIINDIAVPSATPFCTNASTSGMMPAALEYIGTASTTARGTVHHLPEPKAPLKNPSGTNPWMPAHISPAYAQCGLSEINQQLQRAAEKLKNTILAV